MQKNVQKLADFANIYFYPPTELPMPELDPDGFAPEMELAGHNARAKPRARAPNPAQRHTWTESCRA